MINFTKFPLSSEALFIPLDKSSFDEMEVIVGCKADRSSIEEIVAKYAPNAVIKNSAIVVK
jgi:hypothetical protein